MSLIAKTLFMVCG